MLPEHFARWMGAEGLRSREASTLTPSNAPLLGSDRCPPEAVSMPRPSAAGRRPRAIEYVQNTIRTRPGASGASRPLPRAFRVGERDANLRNGQGGY